MRVLSLFDGISGGRVALERAGIPIETYYASEIDKYAMSVAQAMYPDTIQIGDVCKIDFTQYIGKVDMIIGGSPCQDLSIAKQNRQGLQGERSRLFWEYIKALTIIKPKYFLLENVASMKNEDRDAITAVLRGIYPETECIMINSALLSAQQRKRYYWTNWHVEQPEDKGILLKDVLETAGETTENKSYALTTRYSGFCFPHDHKRHKKSGIFEPVGAVMQTREDELGKFKRLEVNGQEKSNALTSVQTDSMVVEPAVLRYERTETAKKLRKDYEAHRIHHGFNEFRVLRPRPDNKSNTLSTVLKDNIVVEPMRVGTLPGLGKGQANRIYSVRGKSVCLNANGGGGGAKTGLYKIDLPDGDYVVRKLTPMECERLQTLPDYYSKYGVKKWSFAELTDAISRLPTKRLSCAINTSCDLLDLERLNLPENLLTSLKNAKKTDVKEIVKQLSAIALNIIKNGKENSLSIPSNVRFVISQLDTAVAEVCVQNITLNGKNTETLYTQTLGNTNLMAQGKGIINLQTVDGFIELLQKKYSEENSLQKKLYIILTLINLITVRIICSSVKITAITYACIDNLNILRQNLLTMELLGLEMESIIEISNTNRYKALGNGWTVDVIAHIFKQIPTE